MDLLKKKDKKSSGKSFHKESKMKNEKKKARKVKKILNRSIIHRRQICVH